MFYFVEWHLGATTGYSKGMQKPVLFIDFDRTLFDTEQLYGWLEGRDERYLLEEKIKGPDFASMLYSDALPFLKTARDAHFLVLLTSTANPLVQKKKIDGSGVTPYLDDVIMVDGVKGNYSGKGSAAKEYLQERESESGRHVFVDDTLGSVSEVKMLNPKVRCVWISREQSEKKISAPGLFPPDDVISTLSELLKILSPMPLQK